MVPRQVFTVAVRHLDLRRANDNTDQQSVLRQSPSGVRRRIQQACDSRFLTRFPSAPNLPGPSYTVQLHHASYYTTRHATCTPCHTRSESCRRRTWQAPCTPTLSLLPALPFTVSALRCFRYGRQISAGLLLFCTTPHSTLSRLDISFRQVAQTNMLQSCGSGGLLRTRLQLYIKMGVLRPWEKSAHGACHSALARLVLVWPKPRD